MSDTEMGSGLIDPLEHFLGYQLRRVSAAAMAELAAALSAEEVSPALATVLLMIWANPGQTQARIGRELSIKRANIAPMIAILEADGLVRRDNNDKRSFGLACTAKGSKAAKRIKSIMVKHEQQTFRALDSKSYEQLLAYLKSLRMRNT